jgi:hypothetical protein
MKIIEITEEGIKFNNGIEVKHYHEQDCCEEVYADWKQLEDTNIMEREFDDVNIEKVKGSGFRINGYFVPCYNVQNGYYSSALELHIVYNRSGDKKVINLNDCTIDKFD